MEELNKCPFCNGEAELTGRKRIKVVCTKCGASSPIFNFKSQAIAYWNNRKNQEDNDEEKNIND